MNEMLKDFGAGMVIVGLLGLLGLLAYTYPIIPAIVIGSVVLVFIIKGITLLGRIWRRSRSDT